MLGQKYICRLEDWGTIDYALAYARQKQAVDEVIKGALGRLILCEHPPVLTLGRMTKPESLLYTREMIEGKGVKILPIDRGGDVTLHAPGQLVVYPIFDLNRFGRDLKSYLEKLEQVAIDFLRNFDIVACSLDGQRGVWVGKQKIVSIGIGVRKWVAFHGIGININTDLALFSLIRPCGLDVQMTSVAKLKNQKIDMDTVKRTFVEEFRRHFEISLEEQI